MEKIHTCKICGQATDIIHNIHAGTGTAQNPDGTPYEGGYYCRRHFQEILLKEATQKIFNVPPAGRRTYDLAKASQHQGKFVTFLFILCVIALIYFIIKYL